MDPKTIKDIPSYRGWIHVSNCSPLPFTSHRNFTQLKHRLMTNTVKWAAGICIHILIKMYSDAAMICLVCSHFNFMVNLRVYF